MPPSNISLVSEFVAGDVPHFHQVWNVGPSDVIEKVFDRLLQSDLLPTPDNSVSAVEATQLKVIRAEAMTQKARALGLQSKFEDAMACLQEPLKVLETTDLTQEQRACLRARIELEKGRILRSSGDAKQSVPHFQAAFAVCDGITVLDYYAVDALHMLAIVLAPEEKQEVFQKALDICKNTANPRTQFWEGALLNNRACDYLDMEGFAEAVEYLKKAMDARQEQYDYEHARGEDFATQDTLRKLKISKYSYGRGLRLAGQHAEALQVQSELLGSGHDGPFLREELAHLLQEKEATSAATHAREALRLGLEVGPGNSERVAVMKNIIEQGEEV